MTSILLQKMGMGSLGGQGFERLFGWQEPGGFLQKDNVCQTYIIVVA